MIEDLDYIVLADKRLHDRLERLVEQLSAGPERSIPGACGEWHETKAAYCSFDNERVKLADLVAGQRAVCGTDQSTGRGCGIAGARYDQFQLQPSSRHEWYGAAGEQVYERISGP